MSEIDDIFAAFKSDPKAIQSTTDCSSASEKNKRKGKKRKRDSLDETVGPLPPPSDQGKETKPSSGKRPIPETVNDPSTSVLGLKTARGIVGSGTIKNKGVKVGKTRGNSDKDNEERFKDSRGSGSRRKTEEGWTIYKEDELGIGDEGGDTSLCPFDCDCCY